MENPDIQDLFAPLGPVTIKRMFGGKGVYYLGRIIAVDFQGDILLKADALTAPAFEAAGAIQWAYEGKTGAPVKMPYWSIPADAFDDPAEMAQWLKRAHEAALRSAKTPRHTRNTRKRRAT
jgi:DNA transformation protein